MIWLVRGYVAKLVLGWLRRVWPRRTAAPWLLLPWLVWTRLYGPWGALGVLGGLAVLWALLWAGRRALAARRGGAAVPPVPTLVRDLGAEMLHLRRVRVRWPVAATRLGWTRHGDRTKPLKLRRLRATATGDVTAWAYPGAMGLHPNDVLASADKLTQAVGCKETVVSRPSSGVVRLRFMFSDPLERLLGVADLPPAPAGQVAYGVRADGSAATISRESSVLIGGMSGQGKSTIAWALLGDLVRQGVPIELRVSDPKGGMELDALGKHVGEQMGTLKVAHYATSASESEAMIDAALKAMESRQRKLKARGLRKHKPTPEQPLIILLLDEFLALTALCKAGAGGSLGLILSQGRAAGVIVIGLAQMGHASELGTIRNLFPQRLCLATPTPQTTETFLGDGAELRGALCSQLDPKRDRGIGYSFDETERHMVRFRDAYSNDADVARIAAGALPVGMAPAAPAEQRKGYVYRVWSWPTGGRRTLLYVGKTTSPELRFAQHLADPTKPWWSAVTDPANQVDPSALVVTEYATEEQALAAEEAAIKAEGPVYNVVHNGGRELEAAVLAGPAFASPTGWESLDGDGRG